MTLMEQYGAERRASSFPLHSTLIRAAAWLVFGVFLFAVAASGSAEDGAAQTDVDPMMEQARRELGRALSERARDFEREHRRAATSILLPQPSLYPMPLAKMAVIQPLSPHALEQAAARLFDPAPFGPSATLSPGQFSGPGRPVAARKSLPGEALPKAQIVHRESAIPEGPRGSPARKAANSHALNKPVRRVLANPEVTGSTSQRFRAGHGRMTEESSCPAGREAHTPAALGQASSCVIRVRG
jgi:hypothetical protein